MTAQKSAARVAVKAAACADTSSDTASLDTARADAIQTAADHDDQPLDIHDICRRNRVCGFTRTVSLTNWDAQAINTRMDGLIALSALLIGANDEASYKLGGWIESGLHNALYALAEDAQTVLQRANDRAAKSEKGSAA